MENIYFSFDDLHILGVFDKNVFVRGTIRKEDLEEEECIISIDKKKFHESLDLWLKDKKRYCEQWNHFCGVMGSISSDDYVKSGKTDLLIRVDDDENDEVGKSVYKDVDIFHINSFESTTDMEHG